MIDKIIPSNYGGIELLILSKKKIYIFIDTTFLSIKYSLIDTILVLILHRATAVPGRPLE